MGSTPGVGSTRSEKLEPRGGGVEGPQGSGRLGWPRWFTELGTPALHSPPLPPSPEGGCRADLPRLEAGPSFLPVGRGWGLRGVMPGAWGWVPCRGPSPLVCSRFFLWVWQTASPPDPEHTLRHKLTLFLAQRCGSHVCGCNLMYEIWFLHSRWADYTELW